MSERLGARVRALRSGSWPRRRRCRAADARHGDRYRRRPDGIYRRKPHADFRPSGRRRIRSPTLGFPGTMGASYIDYIIADPILVPPDRQALYAEKLVHLPHCYMPGDDKRAIARTTEPGRSRDFPSSGFVFCSFNNIAKIVPPMFDVWMRLLKDIRGKRAVAVAGRRNRVRNSEAGSRARGVERERLVFAPVPRRAGSGIWRGFRSPTCFSTRFPTMRMPAARMRSGRACPSSPARARHSPAASARACSTRSDCRS